MDEKKFINWHDSFSVGNAIIDSQHEKWLDIINKFHTAYKNNSTEDIFDEIILELQNYTQYHFSFEEELFTKAGYKESDEHLKVHKEFISKLNKLMVELKENKKNINLKLMIMLREWLLNHILIEDMKYKGVI